MAIDQQTSPLLAVEVKTITVPDKLPITTVSFLTPTNKHYDMNIDFIGVKKEFRDFDYESQLGEEVEDNSRKEFYLEYLEKNYDSKVSTITKSTFSPQPATTTEFTNDIFVSPYLSLLEKTSQATPKSYYNKVNVEKEEYDENKDKQHKINDLILAIPSIEQEFGLKSVRIVKLSVEPASTPGPISILSEEQKGGNGDHCFDECTDLNIDENKNDEL